MGEQFVPRAIVPVERLRAPFMNATQQRPSLGTRIARNQMVQGFNYLLEFQNGFIRPLLREAFCTPGELIRELFHGLEGRSGFAIQRALEQPYGFFGSSEVPPAQSESGQHFAIRSEEHTSELQSQSNLVCRLLLEKKKQNTTY